MEINLILSGFEDLTNKMGIARKCAKDQKQSVSISLWGYLFCFFTMDLNIVDVHKMLIHCIV